MSRILSSPFATILRASTMSSKLNCSRNGYYSPRLGVYYKFDEATNATSLKDEISGLDMTPSYSVFSTSGKIGNGVVFGGVEAPPDIYNWRSYTSPALSSAPNWNAWSLDQYSFTIRLWLNVNAGVTNEAFSIFEIGNIMLKYNLNGTLTFWLYAGVTGVSSATFPSTGWHRVICYWEKEVGIGIKIDDTSTTVLNTSVYPDTFTVGSAITIGGDTGTYKAYIDELGIWKYKWADADMTWDWNNGAGQTYPRSPNHVEEPPPD